jgi:hypothetical protein
MNSTGKFENVLSIAGSKRSPLVIRLNEYEGTKTLDIRKYFTDKKGNLKPTRKGISLGDKNFNIVSNTLKEKEKEIFKWFRNSDEIPKKVEKYEELTTKVREESKYNIQKYHVKNKNWRSPIFFEHKAQGGEDEIIINEEHPFYYAIRNIMKFNNIQMQKEIKQIIYSILISFAKAKTLFQDVGEIDSQELFEIFEFNWGIFLFNYLKEQ